MGNNNRGGKKVDNSDRKTDFFVVKALEDGVNVIGLTRGTDTRFHHAEKLDKDEVMIAQFTEHTSAVKVRGKAIIQTSHGQLDNN
jgi:transcription attenuation protein (tryptophan RNA-binding attenuator protein)